MIMMNFDDEYEDDDGGDHGDHNDYNHVPLQVSVVKIYDF